MSRELRVWECDKCKSVWLNEDLANDCCKEKPDNDCKVCGVKVKHPYLICKDCKEKERYEKAIKIKYSDYKIGCLYDENKEQYYCDLEDLKEGYYNDAFDDKVEPEYPNWCYACVERPFKIDIDSAIEREVEEMYDDFDIDNSLVDLQGLLEYIADWNSKQSAISYYMDYKTVVLLNE